MKKQKRKRVETDDDAADDGAGGSCQQPAVTYMRLSSEMQKKLGGRIYCTEDEISKTVLIDLACWSCWVVGAMGGGWIAAIYIS